MSIGLENLHAGSQPCSSSHHSYQAMARLEVTQVKVFAACDAMVADSDEAARV
jgi:hypothetical protein